MKANLSVKILLKEVGQGERLMLDVILAELVELVKLSLVVLEAIRNSVERCERVSLESREGLLHGEDGHATLVEAVVSIKCEIHSVCSFLF